jgi:hypothetical protein
MFEIPILKRGIPRFNLEIRILKLEIPRSK